MNLGIKVTGISLKGINVPGMVQQINEGSDVYSGKGGRPLRVGDTYQHIRPVHWIMQGVARKLFNGEVLAHVSGRFDVYRPLEGNREVVAKGKFESRENRAWDAIETEDFLGLDIVSHLYIGNGPASRTISPGRIEVRTVTDDSGKTSVLEYIYSVREGGSCIGGLPIERVIPTEMFLT